MSREPMDLLQGTLDVLILRTLTWGPMHGYAATRWIRERTSGTIDIEDAPLYKALHRLEHAGCVNAEWGISENNRRARYYKLTPRGRQQLKAEESAWRRYAAAVFAVLEPAQTRQGALAQTGTRQGALAQTGTRQGALAAT